MKTKLALLALFVADVAALALPGHAERPQATVEHVPTAAARALVQRTQVAQMPQLMPVYDANPRIIHVPQSYRRDDVDDSPQRRATPRAKAPIADLEARPPVRESAPEKPRRRPYAPSLSSLPPPPQPPAAPRRSVLDTPPSIADGPTPVKPTPRWRTIDQFQPPPEDVSAATAPPAEASAESSPPAQETVPLPAFQMPAIENPTGAD